MPDVAPGVLTDPKVSRIAFEIILKQEKEEEEEDREKFKFKLTNLEI